MIIKRLKMMFSKNIAEQQSMDSGNITLKQPKLDINPNDSLDDQIIAALKGIYDPEIPVNIYDLGLIYQITIKGSKEVDIQMTLTAPACPVAGQLPLQVKAVIESLSWVDTANVELVWDPPWSKDRISEEAQLILGIL